MLMFMAVACNNAGKVERLMKDSTKELIQSKEVNGHHFKLTYLPPVKTEGEWCFRLNVKLPEALKGAGEGQQASYGVDTLFSMVLGRDTLLPVHAMRIANGNITGVEYMIIFEKPENAPVGQSAFYFNDWLFTHQMMKFPLQITAINSIDSLSSRI